MAKVRLYVLNNCIFWTLTPSQHLPLLPPPSLRSTAQNKKVMTHQLPGNASSMFGPSHLSTRPEGTTDLSRLGQYDGVILHKSPGRSFNLGNQANQGTEAQSSVSDPTLEEPALACRAGAAAHCSPVAHSPEKRLPVSGEWNDLAPPARNMGATSLARSDPFRTFPRVC